VDESEIIVRVSAESLDQLGRRALERFWRGSNRLRGTCRSHHRNGNHREQTEMPEFSEPMHAVVFLPCLLPRGAKLRLRAHCSNLGLMRFSNEKISSHFSWVRSFFSFTIISWRLLPVS